MSKKILKIVIVLVVILLFYMAACFAYKQRSFAPYERKAQEFSQRLIDDAAFREENKNTYVDAHRSSDLFTPSGLINVINNCVTFNIRPQIFGGWYVTVFIDDKPGGRIIAEFDIDEKGKLLSSDKKQEYAEHYDEVLETMKLTNEIFGKIFTIQ